MDLENDLNLVALHRRQEEISESEMKVVVAGVQCGCFDYEILNALYLADQPSCSCGSMWVLFGLAW